MPSGRLVMVTLRGSRTAMARGAWSFSTSLTHDSNMWGSIVAWATVTPTWQDGIKHSNNSIAYSTISLSRTFAQKLLMASDGKPLLLRAVRVKRRGSSQSLQNTNRQWKSLSHTDSYFGTNNVVWLWKQIVWLGEIQIFIPSYAITVCARKVLITTKTKQFKQQGS